MNGEQLLYAVSGIRDDFIREASPAAPVKHRHIRRWAAGLAACLALALIAVWPKGPGSAAPGCDGAPSVVVDGVTYLESGYFEHSLECPEGFTLAGDVKLEGYSDPCPYYTSPDHPEWVYVYQWCYDQRTREYYQAYVRYVTEPLRGTDLLNLPVIHHHHGITHGKGFLLVVGDENERDAGHITIGGEEINGMNKNYTPPISTTPRRSRRRTRPGMTAFHTAPSPTGSRQASSRWETPCSTVMMRSPPPSLAAIPANAGSWCWPTRTSRTSCWSAGMPTAERRNIGSMCALAANYSPHDSKRPCRKFRQGRFVYFVTQSL